MIYAEKGNRVKKINEAEIQSYAEQGYRIVNERGVVIKNSIPADLPTLRKSFIEQSKKVEALEAEINGLKDNVKILTAENDALTIELKNLKAEKESEYPIEAEASSETQTQKRAKRTKKSELA